ncbi:MAG: FlgD immunoglobulin-like domain containing protein, partial [Candidatus Cloacimonadaceae bacterium]|nr:FlgD immunoglobulin-like domain containing protein [Candidatus Cloacimonadaceae bacterium]
KNFLIIALFICTLGLSAAMPPQWSEFQRDLGIQAAAFKDSPEHQIMRSRDTRSYEVGDTKTFWRWNLSVMPPTWILTPATCRAVGEHSYIFVADSEWNVNMTQAHVDTILVRLEDRTVNDPNQGAIEMDIELFGPIPDVLDNDPRLIVFYSALGSFQGNFFDGYFSPYNQVTEAQAQQMNPPGHSNECEMIYMTCYPLSPVAPIRLSVLAHELQHLIHWGQDANEETWLNEGCSELAMVVYGVPDPITGFPNNPDNNLTAWNQTFADYVKVMLFFTYLKEHYDGTGMIRDLVSDPANGIASLNQQIAIHHPQTTFGDIFANWGVANILDAPTPGNGLYNYQYLDLPNFAKTSLNYSPYPQGQTIQPYATDYLSYTFNNPMDNRAMISNWPIRVHAVFYDELEFAIEVIDLGMVGIWQLLQNTNNEHHVVYVLSNPGPNTINYSITTVANDDQLLDSPIAFLSGNHPNPFKSATSIQYQVRENAALSIEIFNARGQKVRTLVESHHGPGTYNGIWDGTDDKGMPAASGVYLYRLTAGTHSGSRKMILLR